MAMSNRARIEDFFVHERANRRKTIAMMWTLVILTDVVVLFAYLQGMGVFRILQILVLPLAISLVMMWLSLRRKKTLHHRLTKLIDAIEFGWEELNGLDLNQHEADELHHAFTATTVGRVSANKTHLRTRGTDEKGPAFDRSEAAVDVNVARVDPSDHEGDYEGLEDELRVAEQLVEEANQHYAEEAQRQWDIAEQRDMDMVEAGVERLGDLVASGWFEQHPEDGALAALMETPEEADRQ